MKIFTLIITILLFNTTVWGACTTPAGTEGQLTWDSGSSSFKWCNGNYWVNSVVAPGISCTGTAAGTINFDSGVLGFCDGSFWQSMKGVTINDCSVLDLGKFTYDASRKLFKFCDGLFWNAMYTAAPAEVTSILANNNVSITNRNSIPMDLAATITDGGSLITHVCLKYSTNGTPPAAPNVNDSCWTPVTLIGGVPATSISLSDFYFSVAFTPANYTIFSWVKTGANLVSTLSAAGNGTNLVDFDEITFSPGSPPTLSNVFATNTDGSSIPPLAIDLSLTPGSDVFVKWHLSDDEALPGTPIEVSYTTDEINFTVIASGLLNGSNGGCSVTPAIHTGCFFWSGGAPSSSYFKIRVKATDAASLSTIIGAEPNNMSPFKIIAGSQDPGLGSSAASAIIFPLNKISATETGAGNFVVRNNGTFYVNDDRGLMMVDPNDGAYKLFLPVTGVVTDGPIASATLRNRPYKLALDYSDRLLILDYDRIRRVDFNLGTITTIVGGGSQTANGTDALDFGFLPPSSRPQGLLFTALPNGNIWFQTHLDFAVATRADGFRARIYNASDEKIYEWIPTGTGSLEDAAFDPTGYNVANMGIEFDSITSQVTRIRSRSIIPHPGGHTPRSVSYDPITGVTKAPHIPYVSYWADDNTINSRSGEMYSVERFTNIGLHKYNSVTNSWTRIIGDGTKGSCPDGTLATTCPTDITDAFITTQNQIFVLEKGLIRTVDNDGNMLTLFGQSLIFGDDDLAVNARINNAVFADLSSGGKIVFVDSLEHVIREFTPDGNIVRVAGNGNDTVPDLVTLAKDQGMTAGYWGGNYALSADSSDGTIYFSRGQNHLSKIDRSTGLWVDIVGGGGTQIENADGLAGNQIALHGYAAGAFGYNGTQLLRHTHNWNGSASTHAFIKAYDKVTGQQSSVAGVPGVLGNHSFTCNDGTSLDACEVGTNYNEALTKAQWNGSQWLVLLKWTNQIRTLPPGGNIGTLVSLPRNIQSFFYVEKSSVPYVYYCAGQVYKYNLNTATETALAWPTSSTSCSGSSIFWHPTRQSIVFPIVQNGLGGIAEIYDP